MDAKLIAVGIVAIVAASAVGIYFLMGDEDIKEDRFADLSGMTLAIMGNVDGDHKIDQADVDKLNEIIADGTADSYAFADVNNDGKVDSNDVVALKKIVAREKTTVYVVDDNSNIITIKYPLRNVVSLTADMLSLMIALGGKDVLAGYVSTSYPIEQAYIKDVEGIVDLGGTRAFTKAGYANFKTLSSNLSKEGGIGAILYMSEAALGGYRSDFEAAGIPLLWVNASNPLDYAGSALKLGFLFGGDFEKKGLDICRDSVAIMDHVAGKLKGVKKTDCISLTMTVSLTQKNSQYTLLTELSGGNNLTDLEGTSSTALKGDAITKYDGVEYIVSFRTLDLGKYTSVDVWEKPNNEQKAILEASGSYEGLVYLNASIPVPVRVAYVAEILHPTVFKGYGDEAFQEFVDNYLAYLKENAEGGKLDVSKDVTTVVTYQMYKAEIDAQT